MSEENDGRFPEESEVVVRYPLDGPASATDRETWPWLPGTIEKQCGPDEWLVTIEDRRMAELEDGSPAPEGTPDDDLLFPQCYRESSEIQATARLADSPAFNQLIAHQLGDPDAREAGQ